jgi:TPR repeat protein
MDRLRYLALIGATVAGFAATQASAQNFRYYHPGAAYPTDPSITRPNPGQTDFARANSYLHQGDYDLAFDGFTRLADLGDRDAMREIGWMYAYGLGRPADTDKAIGWFEKAALAGDAKSMLLLGSIYAYGIGVPADKERGVYWLEQARKHGDAKVRGAAADTLRSIG